MTTNADYSNLRIAATVFTKMIHEQVESACTGINYHGISVELRLDFGNFDEAPEPMFFVRANIQLGRGDEIQTPWHQIDDMSELLRFIRES